MQTHKKAANKLQAPHLVTVKPLPNSMSIRRNTKKLTENSNFPGDEEKVRQKEDRVVIRLWFLNL